MLSEKARLPLHTVEITSSELVLYVTIRQICSHYINTLVSTRCMYVIIFRSIVLALPRNEQRTSAGFCIILHHAKTMLTVALMAAF